ncbi:hypothetical protein [Lachnoclostridium sp. MSJ-17]|uniref:hypothetical protein n=1 Tax=Lachnoclostridium sp. MSJ-17 TaxID=2841516 RepID=UPI001C11EFB1|nr:hypothetical protein [Lachnoclostridium sp. MSJ-17]MBU5462369.1 hypothetical protein [Lachnoclostridium sp. MSJ-17]
MHFIKKVLNITAYGGFYTEEELSFGDKILSNYNKLFLRIEPNGKSRLYILTKQEVIILDWSSYYRKKANQNRLTAKDVKQYIFENGLIPDVLEKIGCKHIKKVDRIGNNSFYQCSNIDGSKYNAIQVYCNPYINISNFTRNIGGDNPDIFALIQYNKKLKFYDAFRYLCKILGIEGKTKDELLKPTKDFDFDNYDNDDIEHEDEEIPRTEQKIDYQSELANDIKWYFGCVSMLHESWFREGILPLTRSKFDIRYSYKKNRIVFPIRHYLTGDIIAISGRTTVDYANDFDIPKYKTTAHYSKSQNVFGLYENYDSIIRSGFATIFEAEKSVFKRDTVGKATGDYTGVAIQGHFMSNEQAKILCDLNLNEYIVAMDKDVIFEEVEYICSKLYAYGAKKVTYIWDSDNLLDEKDSPADRGYKIYQQLFDNRIYCDYDKIAVKAEKC